MRKFSSFFYKFSTVIMMIIGVIAAALLAWVTGHGITEAKAWGEPSKSVENIVWFSLSVGGLGLMVVFGFLSIFSKKLNFLKNFGKFIIMTISFILILGACINSGKWMTANNAWSNLSIKDAKLYVSIFSISVIVLIMNVGFGILAGILKRKEAKEAKKAAAVAA